MPRHRGNVIRNSVLCASANAACTLERQVQFVALGGRMRNLKLKWRRQKRLNGEGMDFRPSRCLYFCCLDTHPAIGDLQAKTLVSLLNYCTQRCHGCVVQQINACDQVNLIAEPYFGRRGKEVESRAFALHRLPSVTGDKPMLFFIKGGPIAGGPMIFARGLGRRPARGQCPRQTRP